MESGNPGMGIGKDLKSHPGPPSPVQAAPNPEPRPDLDTSRDPGESTAPPGISQWNFLQDPSWISEGFLLEVPWSCSRPGHERKTSGSCSEHSGQWQEIGDQGWHCRKIPQNSGPSSSLGSQMPAPSFVFPKGILRFSSPDSRFSQSWNTGIFPP